MGVAVAGQIVQLLVHDAAIVMLRLLLAVAVDESVTWAVKVNVPLALGVPVMLPFVFSVRPPGSEPLVLDQEYGGAPPFALSVAE